MNPKIYPHPELVKNFPEEVKKLFEVFNDEIRLVGGSVRDLLLEKKVNDFDFTTKFYPDKITEILEKNNIKSVPTGAKFGTITAVLNQKNFEITTLRKDNETDGRHCAPEFVDNFYEDAQRRDFTINALYLDSEGFVYDYFNGINDLEKRKVRFIGEATQRITEDYLRILRFFRFSCEYAKELDSEGLQACELQKENLQKLSKERVRAEFIKMLSTSKAANLSIVLKAIKNSKISDQLFLYNLDNEALTRLLQIKPDANLKLKMAVLFIQKNTDLKNLAQEICATNYEKKYFQFLETMPKNVDLSALKELLAFEEKSLVIDFYLFCFAKGIITNTQNLQFLQNFKEVEFPLNGTDIARLGFEKENIKKALQKAKKFWANSNFKADKQDLLSFLGRK